MFDVKDCLAQCEEKMEMSVMHLEETLSHIRAGKANVHILDEIQYGLGQSVEERTFHSGVYG